MNLASIKDLVTSNLARQVLVAQKHSPKILFVAGTVGIVGATVLACRATLKLDEVLTNHEKNEIDIRTSVAGKYREKTISEDDGARELHKLKLRTAFEITKLYAPAVGLGVLSIGALTGSHVVLSKRNSTAVAAYAALHKGYEQYRERVRKELGNEKDREFAYGIKDEDVVIETSLEGKTVTRKEKVSKDPQLGGSPYAVVFDERSKHFSREPGRNRDNIMLFQNYANEKLRAKGHLFLNEVYDILDLPRTTAGQFVGWVYRHDNETPNGDNYVSFGVFKGDEEYVEAFMRGDEKYAILDFNVDGPIHELI